MSYVPGTCDEIGCDLTKYPTESLFRDLLTLTDDNCLALRVDTDISINVEDLTIEMAGVEDTLGERSTTVASDGDLQTIDTDAEALALNPAANTAGASDVGYSHSFLLRWIVKSLQGLKNIFTADSTQGPSSSRTVGLVATPVAVKASAGNLYGWVMYNKTGADVWVKFCNATSAGTTVGATSVVLSILVPAGGQPVIAPTNAPFLGFSTAITIYSVTEDTDAGTTAPTAGGVTVNILYK